MVLVASGFAVGAATLTARWMNRNAQPAPPKSEQPALIVDPAHLDFGEVWADTHFNWHLPVRNTSQQDLFLESVRGDCTCVSVGALPPRLRAGETCVIPLTLNLVHIDGKTRDPWVRAHQTTFTILTVVGERAAKQTCTLKGRVKLPLRLETAVVQLGTQSIQQAKIERAVKITAAPGVEQIQFAGSVNWIGEVKRLSIATNEFELCLRAARPFAPNAVSETIRLKPFDATGQEIPGSSLSFAGEFVPDVLPAPRVIYFGSVNVGSQKEEEICLRSLTASQFRVVAVNATSPDITVIATVSPTSSEVRYSVQLRASSEGEQQSNVTFQIEEPHGVSFLVVVPVRYLGLVVSATPAR